MMSIEKYVLLLLIALLVAVEVYGQSPENRDSFQLAIQKTNQAVKIDGILNEEVWSISNKADSFWLNAPRDGERAGHITEVFVTYDDRNLYIAAVLKGPNKYVIQTLKRDNELETNDAFGVLLDPMGQKNLGYSFGVNAGGAQTEGMVSVTQNAFVNGADASWDARWYSAVTRNNEGWIVEMAIPFKSVRFKEGKLTWGINFWRIDRQSNETHVWAKVPVQFTPTDLGFTGTLLWDQSPRRSGLNASVTPYVLGSGLKDYESKSSVDSKINVGGDAKVGLTPTLNLDLTVNPDFSQTDVDQQVTNLSRFSIFFPERRQFFLENADVFTNFGSFPDAPFFSRRIGLNASGEKIPIEYGARISGNLSTKWRIGLLNMQTKGDSMNPAQNYSAVALHRRVLRRSTLRALFLNRQVVNHGEFNRIDYARNATGEFEYLSNDGRWTGKLSYSQAFKDSVKTDNQFMIANVGYNGRQFQTSWEVQKMGTNFSADMGFVSRLNNYDPVNDRVVPIGYTTLTNNNDYSFFPKNKRIVRHWMGSENYVWWTGHGELNEWYTRLRYFFFYRNTSQLRFRFNNDYVNLIYPFQVTQGEAVPTGIYHFREFNLQFNTDLRKTLNYEFFGVYGSFYNGYKTTLRSAVYFRTQPWGNFSLGFELNDIKLPAPYGDARYWLINPKMQISFTNTLSWTTFFQYNTQIQNFNINSRLQWRYRPMSDLFLVYTDNYLTETMLGPKNRSLVLKLNYYFQL